MRVLLQPGKSLDAKFDNTKTEDLHLYQLMKDQSSGSEKLRNVVKSQSVISATRKRLFIYYSCKSFFPVPETTVLRKQRQKDNLYLLFVCLYFN